jgi:hypothetical protein
MKLTTAQEEACKELKNFLVGQHAVEAEGAESLVNDLGVDHIDHEDEDEDEEEDNQECDDLDQNIGEILDVPPQLVQCPLERYILEILISLFSHLPSAHDDKFYSPVYRFLILFSLKANGEWLAGRRITQLFAALLFCGRQVIMALMHREVCQHQQVRYSE